MSATNFWLSAGWIVALSIAGVFMNYYRCELKWAKQRLRDNHERIIELEQETEILRRLLHSTPPPRQEAPKTPKAPPTKKHIRRAIDDLKRWNQELNED